MLIDLTFDQAEVILALVYSSVRIGYVEMKDEPRLPSISVKDMCVAEDGLLVAIGQSFPSLYERYRTIYEARNLNCDPPPVPSYAVRGTGVAPPLGAFGPSPYRRGACW